MDNYQLLNEAPSYVHKGSQGSSVIPLDSEFLTERAIFIEGKITAETAVNVFKDMKYLCRTDEPIDVYIYSGGGEVNAGKAIYDLFQCCRNEINTYCIGQAASMAAILLASGTKGHRYILPHGEVMIHEVLVSGGIGGSATSISKISESVNETRDLMNGILAKHTGKTIEEINEATAFDNYMTAEQAVEFGICDKIIDSIF